MDNCSMHVLIIETALTGHHSGYLERIAGAYLKANYCVTVTVLQSDSKHPVIERIKCNYGAGFNVVSLDDVQYKNALQSSFGVFGRELALRSVFGEIYRAVQQQKSVDYVFLPYLDYCLYAIGLLGSPFGSTQWGGICMRPSFHYFRYGVIAPKPKFASIKQSLFLKLLKNKSLKSVYTIDELLHRFVVEAHPEWMHRLQYVPDPAEFKGNHTYESARRELGIPDDAIVILVYGAIDERKGLDVLVEALSRTDVSKRLHLLVVGKLQESIQPLISSSMFCSLMKDGRCQVIDRFVDEDVQQMVFAAANLGWLGYSNHYTMSGVLILAALVGLPTIATRNGLIGWYTKKLNTSVTIEINDLSQVIRALKIQEENLVTIKKVNHELKILHSWDNLIATLVK
jgi:glycosyltransferase involved in cell wall biosynthesis